LKTIHPFVSVVLPLRNESASIRDCVDSVLAQDYPADRFEVIVADGKSDDDTPAVAREYARRDSRVRVVVNPGRIVPTGMNIGIRSARGDVITRVDGHTRIASDYVRTGVETLQRTGAYNVGGPMNAVGGGTFGDAVALASSSRFGVGSYFHFGTEERSVDTVYMGMWPRSVFERVGLFDEELVRNQDDELNYRIRKAGGTIILNPRMRSWYRNRQGVRRLARQYFQYGEWKVRILQKHPRQMSWRHFVPPLFVAILSLLGLASVAIPEMGFVPAALVLSYGGTILAIAAANALSKGIGAWLATAAAFMIIHLAWGTGFLVGLARFAHWWRRSEPAPPSLEPIEDTLARNVSEERTGLAVSEAVGRTV
jgi:glycosyltransferase involved in cell wall biosynthesis